MRSRRLLLLTLVLATCVVGGTARARRPSVADLLERYLAGQYESVVAELEALETWEPVLTYLREHGRTWIDAKGPQAAQQRELAAATFALEAARAGEWHEWKVIRKQPRMCADPVPSAFEHASGDGDAESAQQQSPPQLAAPPAAPPGAGGNCYTPPDVLRWQAPPLLIEWGCELLRRSESPLPIERWWQLAALAVAQRSEDPQFLIGDTNIGLGPELGEIVNTQDEIKHLEHVMERFPRESRFMLAYGIAHDRDFPIDATKIYRGLEPDVDVGAEALMRLGSMLSRRRSNVATLIAPQRISPNPRAALEALEQVDARTRDPYVVYLAHYFAGQIHLAEGRSDKAEAAFRRAVAAVPKAQSATIALASLVFRDGRRTDAQQLIREMLDQAPAARDPWRTFVHADDRFWPRLIARLRAEIAR